MTKKEYFRKVLEKCASNFMFSEGIDIQKAIRESQYCMNHYFAKTDEERNTIKIMFDIISDIAKQYDLGTKKYSDEQMKQIIRGLDIHYKLNLKQYSDKQLLDIIKLIDKENDDGCYTYDLGVLWYGAWQLDELKKLHKEIKESSMTPTEKLIEALLNGNILEQLKKDFPNIKIQDKGEYLGYINKYWRTYANNTFALYKNYKLEIVCTGVLDAESMYNAACRNLKLNNYVGFRIINTKTAHIMKVSRYSDIKRILSTK